MNVDELLAHEEIRQVLYRYARGVDRADRELVAGVYHPDGVDHHGRFHGPGEEFASRVTQLEPGVEGAGNHHITNHWITLDGDRAFVESYFLAFHPHADEGAEEIGISCGRYLDFFERRDGAWKIVERTVVTDWTRRDVMGETWPRASWQTGGFLRGRRAPSDPSYERLAAWTAQSSIRSE